MLFTKIIKILSYLDNKKKSYPIFVKMLIVQLKQIITCWLEPCQLLVKQSLNHHQRFLSAIQQTFQLHHQDPTVYYHLHFATNDNICSFIQLWVTVQKPQSIWQWETNIGAWKPKMCHLSISNSVRSTQLPAWSPRIFVHHIFV